MEATHAPISMARDYWDQKLSLPQKELHILSVEEWVEEVLVAGDSEIALCWAAYETVKLNQLLQIC